MSGTAVRQENDTLAWKPGRRLKPSEYALTRAAGFKWHKGAKAWVASRTPEREAFLLKFVTEIRRVSPTPYSKLRLIRKKRSPAELVDARFTANKKRLILHLSDNGRQFYQSIDLTREGAGLYTYVEGVGDMVFTRGFKARAAGNGSPFIRITRQVCGSYRVRRELAEALVFLLWGREVVLSDWPELEGVQPAQPLSNAAD